MKSMQNISKSDRMPKMPQRRSVTTQTTRAESDDSLDASLNFKESPPTSPKVLLRMVAKEMVLQLKDQDLEIDDTDLTQYSRDTMEGDLQSLYDLVLKSEERTEEEEILLIQKFLQSTMGIVDDQATFADENTFVNSLADGNTFAESENSITDTFAGNTFATESPTRFVLKKDSQTTFSESSSRDTFNTSSESDLSGTAHVEGKVKRKKKAKKSSKELKEAPMDIWHPDFWSSESNDGVSSREATNSSRDTHDGSHKSIKSGNSKVSMTIEDFVKTHEEICSSDSDQSSVVSDISGLTGVFTDFQPDRETRSQATAKNSSKTLLKGKKPPSAVKTASEKSENKASPSGVQFGDITIREYSRILCDNPACRDGPAVGLGWQYDMLDPISIDEYENTRKPTRTASQLVLNRYAREKIIRRWGYTEKEVASIVRELNKLRCQRRQTSNNLNISKMEEAIEMAQKKVKKLLFLGQKQLQTHY